MQQEDRRDGVWIVQAGDDDDGRIVATCASMEDAESAAAELRELFSELSYAFFPVGYRFGQSRRP